MEILGIIVLAVLFLLQTALFLFNILIVSISFKLGFDPKEPDQIDYLFIGAMISLFLPFTFIMSYIYGDNLIQVFLEL